MKELKLIALYYYICKCYDNELIWHCQRFSNNSNPVFTDCELLTIYLYAMMEEHKFKIKHIHDYAKRYLLSWFPNLPSYSAFTNRLNRLAAALPLLVKLLLADCDKEGLQFNVSLVDSMPIFTSSHKRRGKVATELTDKGYCATKKLHYNGVKLHTIAFQNKGSLPFPEYMGITPASKNDLKATRFLFEKMNERKIYADKAYCDKPFETTLWQNNRVVLHTPIKLVKDEAPEQRQFLKAYRDTFSTAVSSVRQPIEAFFNWLIEKTDIQRASKVRSTQGLIVHIFGRIAVAIASWVF